MKARFAQSAASVLGIGFVILFLMSLASVGQSPTTLPTQPSAVSTPKGVSSPRANTVRMVVWGMPQKTCAAYGGKYDPKSGFSEWNTKLVLDGKSPNKIAGTLIGSTGQLQFSSELDGKSALKSFVIKSKGSSFSITASPTVKNQFEVKIQRPQSQTVYVYRKLEEKVQVIKGTKKSIIDVIDKWDALLLFPLLSYKLGVEMGVTGNVYPAALPVHAVALSVATKKHCQVYKMRDRDSDYPREPGDEDTDAGTITPVGTSSPVSKACEGRQPGTREQECYGECGPFNEDGQCICWDWVCHDCCCHVYCREHDAACECGDLISCFLGAAFHYLTLSINCDPCNNPGDIPCKSSTSGSSGGSTCPSGQFYCVHSGSCQPNGSRCEPKCGPGSVYCARVGHCVSKAQCDVHNTCPSGYILIQDKCYKLENVQ
jgi:hypothetical protein